MQVNVTEKKSVYEVGLEELHHVSQDESAHRRIDTEFKEARGREGARLHVTLQAISEADRRALAAIDALTTEVQEKSAQLNHLVQSFEGTADKRFSAFHEDLKARAESLMVQVNSFANAEHEHFAALKSQVGSFQQAIWNQNDTHFNAVSTQLREATERLAFDTRKLRDEVVSLVDARMNQADASFAAIRGDVEVVKYLVMDLIKDRIGRSDPKQKPF
jgi:uncharacterized protein YukE